MSKNNYSKLEGLLNKIDQGNVLTDEEYEFLKGLNNTISNLDSRYATKTYVDEQIASNQPEIPDVSGFQSKSDQLLETDNKTIVGAINELLDEVNGLFQSANNGKELIANAIGEPLRKEDTFNAMSEKIEGLKNELKQVLTDEGVTVTDEDTVATLITKVDEEFYKKNNKTITIAASDNYRYDKINSSNAAGYRTAGYRIDQYNYLMDSFEAILKGSVRVKTTVDNQHTNSSYIVNFHIYRRRGNTEVLLKTIDIPYRTTKEIIEDITVEAGDVLYFVADGYTASTSYGYAYFYAISFGYDLVVGSSEVVVPTGTAVASNVLAGKTFINSTGNVITGTMSSKDDVSFTPGTSNQTSGAGYYNSVTVYGDNNLIPANIVSGKTIFGVTGTAQTGSSYEVGSVSKTVAITTTSIDISFGKTLDKIPSIISISGNISARSDVNKSSETGTTGYISSSAYYTGAYIGNISKTGCTIYFTLSSNSNSNQYANLQWLAVL